MPFENKCLMKKLRFFEMILLLMISKTRDFTNQIYYFAN